jgi:NAD(P)-dependent dehydrogenase (short-subunit alcohol dehydrogenase family)
MDSDAEIGDLLLTIVFTQGTGIGAGIATAFAAAGSRSIALLGRRVEPLKATADKIKAEFPNVHILILSVDVTDLNQVDATFDTAVKEFGPIDILISNAGYCTDLASISDLDPADAWTAFEVHVKGNFNVARAFRRTASKEGAVAIHTSSMAAVMPAFPGGSAYSASKLAATKIWDYFAFENPGIRVVSIQPGTVQTAMAEKIGVKAPDDGKL